MKKNVGSMERIARLGLAAVLAVLYFTGTLSGAIGIIALLVALVMLLTAALSYCPLYAIFGGNGADEDPHKSGVCCGHCGGEEPNDQAETKDGPPIFN